ncbi:F-box and associated interaction domains-containing-like protein [Hibiscus syriacus]|uniref:F-box and associated interaction domains-containing-like protein n=1 Tax=Hibiscus syriacus TaxID=106335 RepID=A0A6A2WRH5_HIBSY|nr:F-box and associated interaction domains-containing-like protein [Hibiscus syriacus]
MSLQLGSLFTVVVSSETTAKEVLKQQDLVFCNRTVPDALRACQFIDFGLSFMPVSPLWRTLRKVCVIHLFSNLKLDANQYLRREKIQELIGNVRKSCLKGEAINIGQAAFDATINLLSNSIFSMDLVDPNSFHATINHEAWVPNLADYIPLLRKFDPQGLRRRMTVYFEKQLVLFGNMFDERLESRKSKGSTASNDVLDTLIDIVEDGSQVLVNAWAIGRDPSIWENPDDFMPERFLGSKIDVKGTDFGLIPFGGGRRICPGLPLANRMLHLILGSLVNYFDWKLGDGISSNNTNMEEKSGLTVKMAKPLLAIPVVV